ncbi:MAG: hypothetical protein AB7R40_23385 [Nitrospiraceae bacterium]
MKKILLAVLVFVGCSSPFEVENATRLEAPDVYASWYEEVQACTGVQGRSLDSIELWVVPGGNFEVPGVGKAAGAWSPPRLFVAEWHVLTEYVVKHEFIHVLGFTHPNPRPPYPPPFDTCSE